VNDVVTMGIDLPKNVFAAHGVGAAGRVALRRIVSRAKLAELVAQLPRCLIAWKPALGRMSGRRFLQLGHSVKLMSPAFECEREDSITKRSASTINSMGMSNSAITSPACHSPAKVA
jgi:hypothetical protein